MTRKLGWLLLVIAWSAMASASGHSGQVSGFVRNAQGVAQMGAAVEMSKLGSEDIFRAFTDTKGYFALPALAPGKYTVKVTAPSFLPSVTQNLALQSGARLVMNITLNTLFEAVTLLPERKKPSDDQDDWKWTLRSMANRPILRVVDGTPSLVSEAKTNDSSHGTVSFIAGPQSAGFGSSGDYGTSFNWEESMFSGGTFSFAGNVAGGEGGDPGGVVRAAYRHEMADGTSPEVSLVARRVTSPNFGFHSQTLQSIEATAANTTRLMQSLEVNYGAALQEIQFAGKETAFRPFASVAWHFTPNTVIEYRYATTVPNMRDLKGYDTAPADFSESDPRVTLLNGHGEVESASHHELAVSQRYGKNSIQVAIYADHITNTELLGLGNVSAMEGNALPDVFGGTFSYNGGTFSANGMRIVFERKLPHDVTATLDYAFGGVLDLDGENIAWSEVRNMLEEHRTHAITAKVTGTVPGSRTRWIASYRWMNGTAITPVDLFNTSPGQSDPFLNVFVRQPLPHSHLIPGKMEAVVDMRNLLAQGYIPVISPDGGTVYLVQSARSVRGGVSFTF
ncbi:hypothetical protein Acid345_3321 [Candidatus Koribacter versatilis Ellin345]|uniref:Carboxypeptidase regulatory-like domain-containing protein n=1 Tax=Koribacter versatilis (strain Ellin345) TaxID=204669 RepID=Q1ILC8_KORVE|nr:carboxypeptidase-like regulatory domain-containing protein [Candidatus Koribacter versatilis]ABF42322.1 hypothetical protein Acid345_3321 [Candidatus Koribacter versatilis Ellin345]